VEGGRDNGKPEESRPWVLNMRSLGIFSRRKQHKNRFRQTLAHPVGGGEAESATMGKRAKKNQKSSARGNAKDFSK